MAFQPAPGIAKVAIDMSFDGTPAAIIHHARADDPITAGTLSVLTGAYKVWITTELVDYISNSVYFISVTATSLESDMAPQYIDPFSPALYGAVGGDCTPNQVALVVTHRTGLTGRSARGRTYVPGIPEGVTVNSRVTTSYRDGLGAAFEALRTILPPVGWTPVVLSRYTAGAARPTAIGTDILRYEVRSTRLDTQRRRLPAE